MMHNSTNGTPSGHIRYWLISTILLLISSNAFAVLLDIQPPSQTLSVGGQTSVDVFARSLGSDRIGGFDIDLSFDGTVLGFNDVVFGSALGDPLLDAITTVTPSTNMVEVAQVSLLFSLAGLQDGSDFLLFSLVFDNLAEGLSPMNIDNALIGDELGFAVDVNIGQSASVLVEPRAVPEPGILLLFTIGLLMLGVTRLRPYSRAGISVAPPLY